MSPVASSARRSLRAPRAPHLGPERRRPQLLDTAREIALAEGISAVTIASVAARSTVTRPVVYACFNDRVELVEALLDRESDALVASVLDSLHTGTAVVGPEQAFVDGFRALLRTAVLHGDSWRLLMAGDPDPDVRDRFQLARDLVRRHATDWIGPAMSRWWHTEDLDRKLPVLIEFFMSTCEGAIRSLLDQSDQSDQSDRSAQWSPDELGALIGSAMFRALAGA